MKKENSGKKSLLWLWITIGVVAALVVAGVLCFALGVFDGSKEEEKFTSKIYWNMDGQSYMDPATGLSDREASDDGMTYIRFAVGGEVKELPVADRTLVHKIDMKVQMCLKFDDNGVIVDIVDVEEVYTKIADKVFVTNVTGDTIMTNSSMALNGMPLNITLNENTGIYNMTDKTEKPGYPGALEMMDQILVYGTDENTPTDIFITHRYWYSDVYWRVSERMYDATNKCTTRERADDGYWYVDWTVNGETVTLRTLKQDVANAWDGYTLNAACCGMVFDENGDVIDCFNAALAARGSTQANNFDVTALAEDGSSFTATRLMFGTEIGKTYTSVIDENTKIYNVNCTADVKGQPDKLQMNDRVFVLADTMGKAKIVYITNRMVDSPMYYNVSRSWSTGLKRSQRTPDADGWYHIKLAVKGKEVTYRTRDFDLVNQIDSYSLSIFGLKVENGIILKAYDAVCVTGNYSFATNNFVDSVDGVLLATSNAAGTAANGVMSADCEVYDVSGHGKFKGVATTVRVGDRVICYQNTVGEITHVYILNRHEEGTALYWNVNRYYSGGKSTRDTQKFNGEPLKDDKYYYFRVIKVGQTEVSWVKVSVDDVDIVNRMDSYGTPTAFSLRVNSQGVVTAAYPCNAASGGYMASNYLYVTHADAEVENKWRIKAYSTGATGSFTVADDVKIYNFSQDTYVKGDTALPGTEMKGSTTSIKVGDRVSCIAGRDGKIHTVFIVERETPGSFLVFRKGGKVEKSADGFWYFELLVDGKLKIYKTDNELIANKINAQNYGFSIKVNGDVITGVYHAVACDAVTAQAGGQYYDVESIGSDGKVTLRRNRVGQSDVGATASFNLGSDYKVYTIDPYAPVFGAQIKLKKGDRVAVAYLDKNSKVATIFVAYECTREGGNMGYCAHCGETVHWESVAAGYAPAKGYVPEVAHYYVPFDYASASSVTFGHANQLDKDKKIEATTEIVLDLNGKVWTRKGTVNKADGIAYASGGLVSVTNENTVIITDYSKTGTGAMVSQDGIVYKSGYTGLAHSQKGATMIIEKGLFDASGAICTNQVANGGAISVGGTLIVNGGTIKGFKENTNAAWGGCAIGSWGDTSITINGGTIIGGKATNMGGTISANSDLTINGGKIYGGSAAVGDNIRFGNGDLVITGGEIDGGIHVSSAKSITLSGKPVVKAGANYGLKPGKVKLDVSGLKSGASVYVDVSGVFTKDLSSAADAQALITNGALKAGTEGMMLKVEGKAVASVSDGKLREWTDATKLPDMGYWKLAVDVNTNAVSSVSGELYIDLNGHNITRTVAKEALGNLADKAAGVEKKSGTPQVFNVGGGNKLTIADSTGKPGTVSVKLPAADSKIHAYSAVIHVASGAEMVLEGGIIDGSNVDNVYVDANNGTISVGGKLTVNGGEIKGFKRGSSNGGAIGGWANTEIVINGGKIYAGGSFLTDKGVQKVNGAAIATTGKLTVNGGEFIGPGKNATEEQKARSGGLIYANGDSLEILGGTFRDGFGTGYGFNIYYQRDYRAAADANGNREHITGGGEVVIGGDAYINGGVTIRSGKADVPVKLTVKDNAVIDASGAVDPTNIRLVNGELYLNADTTPITTTVDAGIEAGKNYDISILYTCKNAPKGFNVGKTTKYEHTYGDDYLCDDCGYDKNTPVAWTNATKLPTSGNYYLDVNVEVSGVTNLSDDLYLDLNGHTVTVKSLSDGKGINTGAYKLTITDSSAEKNGKITTPAINGTVKGLVFVAQGGQLILEAGTIDGSNLTNTYTGANAGTITVANGKINGESAYGAATINGGKVIGMVSSGNGSAIGMMNLTSLTINGGEIQGNTVTKSVADTGLGGAIVANGHLTITGGKIYGGTATDGGDNIYVNNASANVVISGGEIDGGLQLNAYATATISGNVTIKEGAKYGLKIKSGKTVDLTGLTGGEIYVDATGTFTTDFADTATAETAMAFLKAGVADQEISLEGKAIKMGAASLPSKGTYKLTQNMTISETLELTDNLVLDLNGYTITSSVAPAIKTAGKTLTIKDTSGKTGDELGKITTTTIAAGNYSAGIIYANASSEVTIENGIIDGSNITTTYTSANAGTITVSKTLTVNGGKIIGWNSCGNGGAIGSWGSTSITINGGEIVGGTLTQSGTNTATGHGGAIAPNGNLTINGGKISGGTAVNGGDNIWINNAASVVTITGGEIDGGIVLNNFSADSKISGAPTIKEGANYGLKVKSGKTIDLTGLTGGEIYIDAEGTFTTNFTDATAAEAAMAFLKSGNAAYELVVDGSAIKSNCLVSISLNKTELELTEGEDETLTVTKNPAETTVVWTSSDATVATVVDGKITALKAGTTTITATGTFNGIEVKATCDVTVKAAVVNTPIEEQDWVEWTDGTKLPTAGKYKLTVPVTFSATQSLTGELWLDLNGQTVTMTGNAQAINTAGQKLVIDDLSGKTGDQLGTIKTTATSINASAAVIYVSAIGNGTGGELVLNNGIIDGSSATNTKTGVTNGTVVVGNATNAFSRFTMNGGVIKGQKGDPNASGTGGSCVGLYNSTTFVMNGGKLIARTNTSDTDYVASTGSCISAGGASGSNPVSSITINGGELIASRTRNHGGAIATAGNLTINGGTIYGAKTQNSSIIWSNGPSVTINGGVLIGGTTVANPGNGAIDKQGGTITVGGNAVIGGGINVRGSAKLVFTGTPVVDSKLGAEQKFDVRINGGSVHLDSASNTAISNTTGNYKVVYGADGKVSGLAAYAAMAQTESATIPTTGNVKLTADVTLTETLVTTGTLRIDLNGHTVTYTGNAYAINAKHNLIIDDTATGENKGTIKTTTANVNGDASVIYVTDSAKLIIVDGIIDGTTINAFATDYAGAVTLYNKSALYMLGGEIKGQRSASAGSTGKGGGCVAGRAGSLVVIYDGKLTAYSKDLVYGTTMGAAQGSCISTAGTTYIHGGTLQANIVANHGGAIYSTGDVYITDGLITGGTSTNSGNISCSGNILSITGGTIIDGTAKSGSALGGHNIDKLNGTLIIGGDAVIAGGVSTRGSAKVVLSGNAVIDKTLQTAQKYNLRLNSTGGIFLNEATGTALTTTKANYKLTHNAAGLITGVEAE